MNIKKMINENVDGPLGNVIPNGPLIFAVFLRVPAEPRTHVLFPRLRSHLGYPADSRSGGPTYFLLRGLGWPPTGTQTMRRSNRDCPAGIFPSLRPSALNPCFLSKRVAAAQSWLFSMLITKSQTKQIGILLSLFLDFFSLPNNYLVFMRATHAGFI